MTDSKCACCFMRADLIESLGALVKRREQFDAVFLETTGLADLAPIVITIITSPLLCDNFKIDAVLCVADAQQIKAQLDEVSPSGAISEMVKQVRKSLPMRAHLFVYHTHRARRLLLPCKVIFADRVLLNKSELVTPEHLVEAQEAITSINHFAEVIECTHSQVADLSRMIGLGSFNVDRCVALNPELFDQAMMAAETSPVASGAAAPLHKRSKVMHKLSKVHFCCRCKEGGDD